MTKPLSATQIKKAEREAALKRKKRNNILIAIAVISLIVLFIGGMITFSIFTRVNPKETVYTSGSYTITFNNRENTFTFATHDGAAFVGEFTKSKDDDKNTVLTVKPNDKPEVKLTVKGNTIEIPKDWSDGHNHGDESYILTRKTTR